MNSEHDSECGEGSLDSELKQALALLEEVGAEDIDHPRGSLGEHLRGTYEVLGRWGCERDVCLAGLYHSVYGTDAFKTVTVSPDARDKVAAAIGEEAEKLVYTYCVLVRESLYDNLAAGGPPYAVLNRFDQTSIPLRGADEYAKLLTIDLANRLEQIRHSQGSRERFAKDRRRYLAAAPLLPPKAVNELRRTRVSRAPLLARRVARRLRRTLRS